jgi:tyrosinase
MGSLHRYHFFLALYPFHSDDANDFWTSASVRSTATFGYSYPEIVDWGVDQQTLQNNVRAAVNNLYNPSASTSNKKRSILPSLLSLPTPSPSTFQLPKNIQNLASKAVTGVLNPQQFVDMRVNNLQRHWAVNIGVNKLVSPCSLRFHLNIHSSNV